MINCSLLSIINQSKRRRKPFHNKMFSNRKHILDLFIIYNLLLAAYLIIDRHFPLFILPKYPPS
jgi:hypothetical protein